MTYTCDACGGTFESKWSEAEAQAEYSIEFAKEKAAGMDRAVICDDCYRAFMERFTADRSARRVQ
jgi:hypothetical protein